MNAACPNCGSINRSTSRFCARCGHTLHPDGAEGQAPGAEGSSSLDLPWLQSVQERALKPKTERLTDAQPVQTTPTTQEPEQATEQPQPAPSAMQAPTEGVPAPSQPSTIGTTGEGASAVGAAPQQPPADPNEAPPEWVVSILEPTVSAPPIQEGGYEPEELEHIMPWMHGGQGAQGRAQADQGSETGLPPWLSDITVQETLQSSSAGQEQQLSNLPDLDLEGIEPFVPPAAAVEEVAGPQAAAKTEEVVPTWLRSITGAGALSEPPAEPATDTPAIPAEPTSTVGAPPVRDIPVRAPRAGSVEVLASLIGSAAEVSPAPRKIAREEFRSVQAVEGRGGRSWLLPDGITYLVIVGLLLAVLIVRPQFGDITAPSAIDVQKFYDAVETVSRKALPQERIVLVAYDWDATRSAEMSILAESVMRHLMARHIGFITVSTNPQGPGFAQQITSKLRGEYGYEYGREYLVMGYLPGSQAALGALASDFRRNLPIDYEQNRNIGDYRLTGGSNLQSISDFALVITLASDESELRNWVEQVGARTGVPIIAAVPQGLEPLARPYRDIPGAGLQGLISGPTGALQYTKQLQAQGLKVGENNATPLADRLNAQSAAQILVAAVIIIALVGMGTRRVVRRQTKS